MKFKIQFDWHPELQDETSYSGTYGNLRIYANSLNLTENRSKSTNQFQDGVVVSAVPLVEWLVSNWHFINFEQGYNRAHKDEFDFELRHRIVHANYGFVWPDITFLRFGDQVRIRSSRLELESSDLIFTSSNESWIDFTEFKDQIIQLVDAIILFLKANDTAFEVISDWDTIQHLDQDEQSFSMVSSALGHDPFQVEDHIASQIVQLDKYIQKEYVYDFANFLHPIHFLSEAKKADQIFRNYEKELGYGSPKLSSLKAHATGFDSDFSKPWEKGYTLARKLSSILGIGEKLIIQGEESLYSKFGIDNNEQKKAIVYPEKLQDYIDAALLFSSGNPFMLINDNRADNRKFAFLRLIFKFLSNTGNTRNFAFGRFYFGFDEQVSRAFAAEFLAPEKALRKEFKNKEALSKSELRKYAETWIIPEKVLQHQIKNHKIIKISDF